MEVILVLLIVAILNGAVAFIDEMLSDLVPMTLHADQYMIGAGGGSMVDVLFEILLGFGVSLIILKFLKKGFECYVMWTDGDPDSEPVYLVIRFIQAVAVAVCFPVLYGWMADITTSLTDELLAAIGAATDYDWMAWVNGLSSAGIVTAIFGLVFVISYFMLYFQFLMRGLEIMILRIGVPVACVGLLDNDKGVFKNYMMKFFQSAFSVVVQITLCKLGVGMMMNMSVFWGIACIVLAIKTPPVLKRVHGAGRRWQRRGEQCLPFRASGGYGKKSHKVRRWRYGDDKRYFHGCHLPYPGWCGIPVYLLYGTAGGCGGRAGAVPEAGKEYGAVLCACGIRLADKRNRFLLLWGIGGNQSMEHEISLYIPMGVKAQNELFNGFGRREFLQSAVGSLLGGAVAALLWIVSGNVALTVVAALTGIFGSVMMCTKDQNNQSVVDQIGNMVRFGRSQQIYPYRMLDEWQE